VADAPGSRLALVLDDAVDLDAVITGAREVGALDHAAPLASDPSRAREVRWGGRLQRAVVRVVPDGDDLLLRVETLVATEGWRAGLAHQARLVADLAQVVAAGAAATPVVRDLSARRDRDRGWLERAAAGELAVAEAVGIDVEPGRWSWLAGHGAARFGVPDLELYGVPVERIAAAESLLVHVVGALLERGLGAPLDDGRGRALRLVPVLEAWQHLPVERPGVGRAGRVRGPGLDGPRATLSVLHRRRLGRHRLDLTGVVDAL
jgi:hypothetical protein